MGKYKPMTDHQYADMYGLQMKDEYDDEGNANDNEHLNRAMIDGHQANNYDMRRTHEMLQDDGFRRHMKEQGFKGVDRMVKRDNMPSSAMLTALQDWGGDIGTHNGKGSFDTRDLGATFKAFAKENQSYGAASYEDMMDQKVDSMRKKMRNKQEQTQAPVELSETAQGANDIVNSVNESILDGKGLVLPKRDDAAEDMAADFKVKVGAGLKEAGIPTRGPGAVGTPGGFTSRGSL